jgi:hypothetical protein
MRNAIDPLIAELRAARKVVEAVRPVHCRPDSVGGYTYDDRPIRAAIEEYDAVVKL